MSDSAEGPSNEIRVIPGALHTDAIFQMFAEIEATATTNCPQGGDASHGGETVVMLRFGTGEFHLSIEKGIFMIVARGDDEALQLHLALTFLGERLGQMLGRNRGAQEAKNAPVRSPRREVVRT